MKPLDFSVWLQQKFQNKFRLNVFALNNVWGKISNISVMTHNSKHKQLMSLRIFSFKAWLAD